MRCARPVSPTRASVAAPEGRRGRLQALILAGGEGTRLRPLTSTVPKPVVPLVDRPFMAYALGWLRSHGVDDVVLACGFMASGVRNVLGDGDAFDVRLRYAEEPSPRGTGGAVKFAEPMLDERFLVLNGDVLTDLDLSAQIRRHEEAGARATLALIGVEDPSNYGLVRTAPDGAVEEFVEKPSPDQIDTNLISAGAYVLERSVLDLIPGDQNVSIEREVFPELVGNGLFAVAGSGYWLDIGTPERYLEATWDILAANVGTAVAERLDDRFIAVAGGARVEGRVVPPVLVESGASVAGGAVVGSRAVLGASTSVGAGSHLEGAVLLQGASVGEGCTIRNSILGPGASVGDRCHIEDGVVLGEGTTVGADNVLAHGVRLYPGVALPDGAIRFG